VKVPAVTSNNDDIDGTTCNLTTFHLHHTIVKTSSHYFATFPEPKVGRTINDLDSSSFAICVEYMYTGEGYQKITHDNVANVLNAVELLQIDGLKQVCLDYLDMNINHDNYEQVVTLADRYNSEELKESAMRFESVNSSRDALVSKRETLVKSVQRIGHEKRSAICKEEELNKQLKDIEEQLDNIFDEQRTQILLSKSKISKGVRDPGSFHISDSIGHVVHPSSNDLVYEGSSTYGDTYTGNVTDCYDYKTCRTPPPTESQFQTYGIVKSHDSILTAIKAAKSGDRIYLLPGDYDNYNTYGDDVDIKKSLEFIGLGDVNDIEIEMQEQYIISAAVGFYNIKFLENRYWCKENYEHLFTEPNCAQGAGSHSLVYFDAPGEGNELVIKNCVFKMGTTKDDAFPTRVSGVFVQRSKSAIIEGCNFIGGAGSAIVVVSDPRQHIPKIEINGNNFINNGQPFFTEVSMKLAVDSQSDKKKLIAIPSHEITPGPASVELWKFKKEGSRLRFGNYNVTEQGEHNDICSANMSGNKFTNNLRAPLVYRDVISSTVKAIQDKDNSWELYDRLPDGGSLISDLLEGFNLSISNNVLESNGLSFDKETVSKMKCNRNNNSADMMGRFLDGNSLLVIKHSITRFDQNSFPHDWEVEYT